MTGFYVDISSWQADNIDWPKYVAWSKTYVDDNGVERHDGVSRLCVRASEYFGKVDDDYVDFKNGFLAAGGQVLIHYAYVYPQHNSPQAEAEWMFKVVGDLKDRPQDVIMLDMEEQVPQANADWAYNWLQTTKHLYGGRLPTLYASYSYIIDRLQGIPGLADFPLTLADWQFNPNERPVAPPPFKSYEFLQWTDKESVPGIQGTVDGDKFMGRDTNIMPPVKPPSPPVVLPPDLRVLAGQVQAALDKLIAAIP